MRLNRFEGSEPLEIVILISISLSVANLDHKFLCYRFAWKFLVSVTCGMVPCFRGNHRWRKFVKSRTSNAFDLLLTIPELQPDFKAIDSAIYPSSKKKCLLCRESVRWVSGGLAISKKCVTAFNGFAPFWSKQEIDVLEEELLARSAKRGLTSRGRGEGQNECGPFFQEEIPIENVDGAVHHTSWNSHPVLDQTQNLISSYFRSHYTSLNYRNKFLLRGPKS